MSNPQPDLPSEEEFMKAVNAYAWWVGHATATGADSSKANMAEHKDNVRKLIRQVLAAATSSHTGSQS